MLPYTNINTNGATSSFIAYRLYLCWLVVGAFFFLLGGNTALFLFANKDITNIVSATKVACKAPTSSTFVQGPNEYIIQHARSRAAYFRSIATRQSLDILAHNHPAFADISPQFQPLEEWKRLNFPNINVAGLPKAGTSQLYQILTSHPSLTEFHKDKEFCFNLPFSKTYLEDLRMLDEDGNYDAANTTRQDMLQQFFFQANNHSQPNATELSSVKRWYMLTYDGDNAVNNSIPNLERLPTINGCHDTVTVLMQHQYLQLDDRKLVLLVRDPADWLWSAWNFWHTAQDQQPPQQADWASPPYQYRSPELFHELLLSGDDRYGPAAAMLQEYRDKVATISSLAVAAAKSGGNNGNDKHTPPSILVWKSEDMVPDRIVASGFLAKLADFVGISPDGFDNSTLQSFANCGDNKGTQTQCLESSQGAYEITQHRPMLEASRELVYLHFAEECNVWAEAFGVVYEECLAVRKKYGLGK
jgi:hypothetical protein